MIDAKPSMLNAESKQFEDSLEYIIKEQFSVGEVYKNKSEIYYKIGLSNLGISNLNGGIQKKKAFEIVTQYMEIEPIEEGKRAVVIEEIFDTPRYIVKKDNRGKRGVYVDNTVPVLSYWLSQEDSKIVNTSLEQIAIKVGLLKRSSSYDINKDELIKNNKKYTRKMYGQFYERYKPVLDRIVFTTLDKLDKEYKAICYDRLFEITKISGKKTISDSTDIDIIAEAEKKALEYFEADRVVQIHKRGKAKDFYEKVIKIINEEYGFEWDGYRKIIRIYINEDKLEELNKKFTCSKEMIQQMQRNVTEHFVGYLQNKTATDYEKTNREADKILQDWEKQSELIDINEIITDKEIKEAYELGIYSKADMIKIFAKKPKPFRYHDDYIEIQNGLIKYFIGEVFSDEVDMKWLDELEI